MSVASEGTVRLRDGRSLGYAEYGDPKGRPILHFHGFPSSRFEGQTHSQARAALRLHARVLVVERPGLGHSDFKPHREIADWPEDVVDFADALGLDRFAVVGVSAGGPYALACACKIPRRLTAVGIVSGIGPLEKPGASDGMTLPVRLLFTFARRAPSLVPLIVSSIALAVNKWPDLYFGAFTSGMPPGERILMKRRDVREMFERMVNEAFRAGTQGAAMDLVLMAAPWNFSVCDIRVPVYLWHGDSDKIIPPFHGRQLAKAMPGCRACFYPDEGHTSVGINHFEEIIGTLVG